MRFAIEYEPSFMSVFGDTIAVGANSRASFYRITMQGHELSLELNWRPKIQFKEQSSHQSTNI